ncbi:MAG: Gfo/Idh/MocA family oxidoreductase [Chloroflexi bacterium]|nr:Gfo/Idh/MocA family oxidoreductase [Chloroflexota bacterium]
MKRYAIVGTGGRAAMFIEAITQTYAETSCLVGICDLSPTRMNWYNKQLSQPCRTFAHTQFDDMIKETQPDTVIVCTIDATHHSYIVRAMELGCDVITEKPMTIDLEKLQAIYDGIARTGKSLRVTFNYRYAPAFSKVRELVMQGAIGIPLFVDFSWMLDTTHGADYFRRWHREKQNSGGLLVHKATHHFDLVNWWIDSYPAQVFASGDLYFYGKANAEARGEHYGYKRYTGEAAAKNDPFAKCLDTDPGLKGLYLDAEADSGYIRDRNVFGEPINIEDTMCVIVKYQNGIRLSYSLVAYSPWEGLRLFITGTKGRLELYVHEGTQSIVGQASPANLAASKAQFREVRLTTQKMFDTPQEIEVAEGVGGHGGADPLLLDDLFNPLASSQDPLNRAASHIDGAASVLVGISANLSMRQGVQVNVSDLFPLLPQKRLESGR